ncbi:hypothetical protein [Mycobacterium sp. 236(2023)]|uniref:hypothetical protein n=1 Tax=Mycobacterium sp. 236(2023) TaxID=3038163 RepID=UPI0024156370|nr:hypothetical protein [Mycobacterium sp. 236(2023)]MDG4663460.1 hypothetical protein [Mycobacterium sp. 236(2023)]
MRSIWVAGVGGLVVGHILWLAAISFAVASTSVSTWVLVTAAVSFAVGVAAAFLGRRKWRQKTAKAETWAAFLWGLPILPVLLSVVVLGVTYL